jgi:hypothetical protein
MAYTFQIKPIPKVQTRLFLYTWLILFKWSLYPRFKHVYFCIHGLYFSNGAYTQGANTSISVYMAYTFQMEPIIKVQTRLFLYTWFILFKCVHYSFAWIPALRTHFLQKQICYRKVVYTKYTRLQ